MLQIVITKKGIPKAPKRFLNQNVKDLLGNATLEWRKEMMPKHFEMGAGQIYKYEQRAPRYKAYKRRRGLPPLVYSGKSRKSAMENKREPTGTSKQARLVIVVPRYMYYHRHDHKHKQLAEELLKITHKEAKELKDFVVEGLTKRIKENSYFEKKYLVK